MAYDIYHYLKNKQQKNPQNQTNQTKKHQNTHTQTTKNHWAFQTTNPCFP